MAADDDDHLDRHSPDREIDVPDRAARVRLARLRRAATRVDTDPRWVEMARRVRRVLPGDDKFGDPLSTAGRAPVEVIARGVTSLRSEPDSVIKEIGLTGLQVWQSMSEATGRGRGEQELALLFTDLVGFSSWALQAGDEPALELLRQVGLAVETTILEREGRVVKRLGDGLMATFVDAGDAVDAALQAAKAVRAIQVDGYSPRMRAGVHWGRPRRIGGDYLGIDVNVAARVAEAAKADQVLVSDDVLRRVGADGFTVGRRKRLKAEGAPRDLQVVEVSRA
jgi:adenylate cyclase